MRLYDEDLPDFESFYEPDDQEAPAQGYAATDEDPGPSDDGEQLPLAEVVGSHVLQHIAPDSAEIEHELEHLPEPANLIARLLKLGSRLLTVRDYGELLQQSLTRLIEALPDIHAGVLWLNDTQAERLRAVAVHNLPLDRPTQAALESCQMSLGENLAGLAWHGQRMLWTETHNGYGSMIAFTRPYHEALLHEMQRQLPQRLIVLCVPLLTEGQIIGVLELFSWPEDTTSAAAGAPVPPPAEQETDDPTGRVAQPLGDWMAPGYKDLLRSVLPIFGQLVAGRIKNKQMYDQLQQHRSRLDAFDAVVTAISTATDLQDLLRSVLDVMIGLLPVSTGAIYVLDPAQARLTLGTQRGLPADYIEQVQSFPVSGAACEEVVRYGQPTLRPLIEERGETALLAHGLESCAYLPLLAGGTVVGVLGLYGGSTLYKEIDMGRLMPLGNQVGFAIANVRLYEETILERNKLKTVINSIAEGVVLCDSQGRLILANGAAMELLSLDSVPYEQPLSDMSDFYGIRDLEGAALPVEQLPMALALSGETFHDHRVLLHGISGDNSVMSFSGAPVRAENGTTEGAVVIFRDVTANQKLERAKDEFLAVAAHELRSPLAAVRSYAEMLLRRERQRTEQDSRDLRGLSILSQQVTHMLRMVDNLLDVSRLDAGQLGLQLQSINLVSLITQVLDQQRPSAPHHELVLDTVLPELWIDCDSMRVRQVLTNLVSNAIKYSPSDTVVTVHLSSREVEPSNELAPEEGAAASESELPGEQLANLATDADANPDTFAPQPVHSYEALVCVADQGSGVLPEQQQRLFERFYRVTNRRAEGLGLGLYLSRQFVLMHGGQIWVESVEGRGSTFCFSLPMQTNYKTS